MVGRSNSSVLICLATSLVLWSTGCSSESAKKKEDVDLPAWLTETPAATPHSDTQLASYNSAAKLGLNLKTGDQFPLRKVVQQELLQNTLNGEPMRNFSQLELMLAIRVTEKRENRTKLTVKYNRVRYKHDIADEHVEFDSNDPGQISHVGAIAYRDMVNDGFSFWIGEDNQISEVEGLSEFIERCLRNVPPDQRDDVILGVEAGSGESGIANFVDNTIGLLPYGHQTSLGDSWERQQQLTRPVPMYVTNIYTLKDLTPSTAVIDIRGTINSSAAIGTSIGKANTDNGVSVTVNGGSTIGSCTIYRDTGLPKESRVDRTVNMTIQMANSFSFQQTKRVTTTIESFPSSSPVRENQNMIRQVSGEQIEQR
ncbi:DUF6263 family protein [Planctomicrobium sp. SH668]|uniref:DUF6263 family protein n=1 Tax=Planctomicrobium sp. SH668 TaxID=3448126 RepID=UPI003F5B6786